MELQIIQFAQFFKALAFIWFSTEMTDLGTWDLKAIIRFLQQNLAIFLNT